MHELVDNNPFPSPSQQPADDVLTALVNALQSAFARPASSATVQQALREVHRIQLATSQAVTLGTISDSVASAFRLAPVDLTDSRKRDARTAMARQIAICISRRLTKSSLPVIGRFYHRDHATILYACQQIERRMARDSAFRRFIEKLEAQIGAATPAQAAA
jgi:chromosomal replication initiator protein